MVRRVSTEWEALAGQRVAAAEQQLATGRSEADAAEMRAVAAEEAKIQLSLKLAQLASENQALSDVSGVPAPRCALS